uniref:Uncharacterized protein n=1 Tax=Arundo donax TaxID=35708 RepID=A0A0A8XU46_ARUDO
MSKNCRDFGKKNYTMNIRNMIFFYWSTGLSSKEHRARILKRSTLQLGKRDTP